MTESDTHIRRPAKTPKVILICTQVIMCFMPIAQLAIGVVYQYDCPRQPYIPIYLLVTGAISLLLSVLSMLPCTAGFGNHSQIWSCLVSFFFFCWFIAGNVWIYSIYEPNYNETTTSVDPYCNKTLYLFSFWTINLTYILLGLIIFSSCCSCFMCGDD